MTDGDSMRVSAWLFNVHSNWKDGEIEWMIGWEMGYGQMRDDEEMATEWKLTQLLIIEWQNERCWDEEQAKEDLVRFDKVKVMILF